MLTTAACGDREPAPSTPPPPDGAGPDAGPEPDAPADVPTHTRGRLAITGATPDAYMAWVIDLDTGAVVYEQELLAPGTVYATAPSSPHAFVSQRLASMVDIVDAGTRSDDSGPTRHVHKREPVLLSTYLDGAMPTHWVSHDGWVVVFNDGDGSFDYIHEDSLSTSRVVLRRAHTDGAHHGAALLARNHLIASSSVPNPTPTNPAARRAAGISVRTLVAPATVIAQHDGCPGLHGEGATDDTIAFGCEDGVLQAVWAGTSFELRKLPHPSSLPQPMTGAPYRVGTIHVSEATGTMIGNWGPNGLVLIDPEAGLATWSYVDIGSLRRSFLLSRDGEILLVLAGDGKLHRLDPRTGQPRAPAIDVTMPFTTGTNAPVLVVDDAYAFVLDPRDLEALEVDLDTGTVARTFPLPGVATSGAVFGAIM